METVKRTTCMFDLCDLTPLEATLIKEVLECCDTRKVFDFAHAYHKDVTLHDVEELLDRMFSSISKALGFTNKLEDTTNDNT